MRLLAYGGTGYAERCRIGSWPLIASGPLEDTYGLSRDTLAFGCGLLDDCLLVIMRQIQKRGQRLFAYSLLLDPGATVWERFEWNAASLVLALLGGVEPGESTPDCFGRQLLDRPEEINEENLISTVEGLPIPRASPAREPSDLLSLWVGAIYSSEPVTVAPQSLGMESRPGIAQTASILQTLPICFRAGLGWLVGGSAIHARPFGAHLVLDDWLTRDAPPVQEYIENGRWIRWAWETLQAHESYSPMVNEKMGTPIWKWAELWRRSPAKSFERVCDLAHVLRNSSSGDQILNLIQGEFDEEGPLEREIRDAFHRRVATRDGPLSRNLTLFLLRGHFDKGLVVDAATAERMDASAVIEFYTASLRRITPTAASGSPPLQAQVRFEIWLTLISTEETAETIPALLRGAYGDLRSEESVRPRIAEIVEASLNRSVTLANNFESWIAHRRDEIVDPLIRERLREESLRRALKQTDNWARDYLAFGLDSGGAAFAQRNVPAKNVRALVAEIARLSSSEDGLREDARKWLSDLARSPLRRNLQIEDKLTLLRESTSASWENFHTMLELYCGNQAAARAAGPPASEREVLVAELTELTTVRFHDDFVPNLRGLISFLGDLPDETVSALGSLRPKLIGHDITGWMEGWEKLRPGDVFQDELIRQVMHSDREVLIPSLLKRLSDERHVELFRQLLFGESALPDEEIFKRFARFVAYAVKEPSLAEKISDAFKDCATDHSKRDTFFQRHCDRASFLNELFKCFGDESQQLVISIVFSRNYQRIENDACIAYIASEKITFALTPYKRALFRFVLSANGERLRKAIATHRSIGKASLVESHLKEMLGNSAVGDEPALERNEKRSFWKRRLFD